MIRNAKYVHTNLIARDWRGLVRFYEEVFGCVPVPPERDYTGHALDAGTALSGARLRGLHLRLPGLGDHGPTLEVFHYDALAEADASVVNAPGFRHIAFSVDDVHEAHATVIAHGGSAVGEIVVLETPDGKCVTWCYVADPEGNIIELQSWS